MECYGSETGTYPLGAPSRLAAMHEFTTLHILGHAVGQREYIPLLWDAINVGNRQGEEKTLGVFTIFESTTDFSEELEWDVNCITPGCILEVMSWPTLPMCVIAACSNSELPENIVKVLNQVRTPRSSRAHTPLPCQF
jgi:hypothetical protein